METTEMHSILAHLQRHGVELRVKDGRVMGPRGMKPELKDLVSEHKDGLFVVLTERCPVCNPVTSVRVFDRRPKNHWALECAFDPGHYSEVRAKTDGVLGLNIPDEFEPQQEELYEQ